MNIHILFIEIHQLRFCHICFFSLYTYAYKIISLLNYLKINYRHHEGFPDSSVGKESACNVGDPGSIPGSERSTQEGIGYPPQYSGLENSRDCIVHGVTKRWTQLSNFHRHQDLSVSVILLVFNNFGQK